MRRSAAIPYYITLVLWTLAFAAAMVIHPRLVDDDWFMRTFGDFQASGAPGDYFSGVCAMIEERGAWDNLRLFNMIGGALNPLPLGIAGIVCGLATGALLYLSARLSGCWRKSFTAYTVVALSLYFFFPWFESMYTVMYHFNYVCAMAYVLFVIVVLLSERRLSAPVYFVLGLIGGMSHEIFGCLLCSAAVAMLFYPALRKKAAWVLIGAVVGLIAILLLVPGVSARAQNQLFTINLNPFVLIRGTLHWCVPLYLIWTLYVILLVCKRYRTALLAPAVVTVMIMSVASWYIFMVFMVVRTGIGVFVCTAILYGMGAGIIFNGTSIWIKLLSIVLWALILVHSAAVICWTAKLRNDYNRAQDYLEHGATGSRYVIANTSRDMPWWLLDRPHYDNILTAFNFQEDADIERAPLLKVMEDFDPSEAENIGIGVDAWQWKGWIVLSAESWPEDTFVTHYMLKYGNRERIVLAHRAVFDAKGRKYCYLLFDSSMFLPQFRSDISGVEHVPTVPRGDGLFHFSW